MNEKIIFCLPGDNFSGTFLDCWSDLLVYCIRNEIKFGIQRKSGSVVNFVRAMCLGGSVLRGENQKPFNGKLDYTRLMWIDSDMVFTTKDFQQLIDDDRDIVSGLYPMSDGDHWVAVRNWDEEYFKQHGTFEFLHKTDHFLGSLEEVSYAGMGFMMVKKGVFESIQYPWFKPLDQRIGKAVDFTSEDVAFCLRAREQGFKIWIDFNVRLGHEKKKVLR